jgi:hypothetical protein
MSTRRYRAWSLRKQQQAELRARLVELEADDHARAGRVSAEVRALPSGKKLTIFRKPRPR